MPEDNCRLLVFDLDGTLADTSPDIVDAANATLRALNLENLPDSVIVSFVGDGYKKLLERCLCRLDCFEEKRHKQAIDFFYGYYLENICCKTRLYPEVKETLMRLPEMKAVLTNKPLEMALKLLHILEIAGHFQEIIGGDDLLHLKPDPHFLLYFMGRYGFAPQNTWMIGDSPVDILTARNAGARSIAALYGFWDSGSLREVRPDYSITCFSELLAL